MRRRLPLLVALALAPLVPWAQGQADRAAGTHRAQQEVLYLWSGEQARRFFPGFESLAADIYWLRTVQYFGGQRLFTKGKRFELLRPLIEITTTLDPRLEMAYRYGAIFLSEPPPTGAGRPREGIEVLEKGCRRLPKSWRLWQDLGFFYFVYLDDVHSAARILDQAAAIPGSAYWLRTLAADLLAKGGDRASARRMWQQMYEQAEAGIIRENARLRLQRYDSLDVADQLTRRAQEFQRRAGRYPWSLEELRSASGWRGPLTDGAGVPFSYDGTSGVVLIARGSPLWRPD